MAKTLTADETKIIDLMQHIAEQDAEIAELRDKSNYDLELWCALIASLGMSTGHADTLRDLFREAAPQLKAMREHISELNTRHQEWAQQLQWCNEQLARMPVCVAFTTEAGIKKLTSSTTERDTPISTKKSAVGSHSIPLYAYIAPFSTANPQPDGLAQEPQG